MKLSDVIVSVSLIKKAIEQDAKIKNKGSREQN